MAIIDHLRQAVREGKRKDETFSPPNENLRRPSELPTPPGTVVELRSDPYRIDTNCTTPASRTVFKVAILDAGPHIEGGERRKGARAGPLRYFTRRGS